MAWSIGLTTLRDILADLYPTVEETRRVVMDAGFNPANFAFSERAKINWHNVLSEVDKHDAISAVLAVAEHDFPAKKAVLEEAAQGTQVGIKGPDIRDDVNWRGKDNLKTLEKVIGLQSTLLPIHFLETGLQCARCVGRIVRPDGFMGTGFMIGANLLITSHHVIDNEILARDSVVQFNYQDTVSGLAAPVDEFELHPGEAFATSAQDDWTVVRVKENPNGKWGELTLRPVEILKNDFVNIIQHAEGRPKQIALYHNLVTYVDEKLVQYLTDTLPGSSGSPVFNSRWHVVAVHHSGGWLAEPGSRNQYYRNEGININAVIHGLAEIGLYPAP